MILRPTIAQNTEVEMKTKSQIGKLSRNKGKVYERELAGNLREYGYDAHRGQQFCGKNGDADVVGLPGIHIEAKRREQISIYDWMAQSISEAKQGEFPVVMFRKSNCETLVVMRLPDFMDLYKKANKD